MDSVIINAFNTEGRSLLPYGRLEQLAGSDYMSGDPYFFLKRELKVPAITGGRTASNRKKFQDLKDNNQIAHVTLMSSGEYYDYTFDKAYATLKEWVDDIDGNIKDVMFGVNRVHMTTKPVSYYIPLKTLLSELNHIVEDDDDSEYEPSEITSVQSDVDIDSIVEKVLQRLSGMKLSVTIN